MDNLLNLATLDPNLVYIGLVVGLWLAITAAYVPGTGLPEIGAFLMLIGSFWVLTALPTNWLAVMLVVLGVIGFLVLPFIAPDRARLAEAGLFVQALGGFFLFDGMTVSPFTIVITLAVAWGYHRLILIPILQAQGGRSEFEEANEVVGARGRVVKALDPVGTVHVKSELWTARSDEPLEANTPVIVTARQGLELTVEKAKRDVVLQDS